MRKDHLTEAHGCSRKIKKFEKLARRVILLDTVPNIIIFIFKCAVQYIVMLKYKSVLLNEVSHSTFLKEVTQSS